MTRVFFESNILEQKRSVHLSDCESNILVQAKDTVVRIEFGEVKSRTFLLLLQEKRSVVK